MPFTDAPWQSPESDLDAADFCAVSLIDVNAAGDNKIKANCKLPVRSSPSAPYNRNALRNAASRIFQMKNVAAEEKRKAAKKLVRLMREGGIEVGDPLLQLAGEK